MNDMALKLNYNYKDVDIKDAYLKINNININDEITNGVKIFKILVTYEVKATNLSQPFCVEIFEYNGDANLPLYKQSYDYLKIIFPTSTDI